MNLQSIKALSILQPWASLCVLGHKKIETRSFQRSYRGPLLIHASAKKNAPTSAVVDRFIAKGNFPIWRQWPFGAIIGMVQLVDIMHFEDERPGGYFISEAAGRKGLKSTWDLTAQEFAFGDYSAGRFGWLLSNPIVFPEPIPCKGNLGLWNPTPEVMAQVEEQIKAAEHGK